MSRNPDDMYTVDAKNHLPVLTKFFNNLSKIDQRKVFTAGFKKAARPLIVKAAANAPVGTDRMVKGRLRVGGNLRRSIGAAMIPRDIAIHVGARMGGGNTRRGWHGHLVESGTVQRRNKAGANRGTMPASNFFESAYNSTQEQIYGTITQEWAHAIDRFIVSTNRRLK